MRDIGIKNLKAAERLNLIPKELALGLGIFLIVLGVLLMYFWHKAKERRKLYLHIFDGNLKATSASEAVKDIPKYSFVNAKKILNKNPVPNFRIRHIHLIYLYLAIVLFIIGFTLIVGKPLGIM